MYYDIIESPIGPILVAGNKEGLKHLIFLKGKKKVGIPEGWIKNKEFFKEAARQLEAYFSGKISFKLPGSLLEKLFVFYPALRDSYFLLTF